MSTSTHTPSAQSRDGRQPLRDSSTPGLLPLHQSLSERLAPFSLPVTTTTRQLYDLLLILDDECLRHAVDIVQEPAHDSTSDIDSVVRLVMYLSGPLTQCGHPGTFKFQEIQLRAVISALALLQQNGVHSLDSDVYDRLRIQNISARFQKIAFGVQSTSTLADRIRDAPNMYLVKLAAQYVSFIKRGDSPWPSILGPILDIFFSALSVGGGQYNHIADIFGGLNRLVNIWQRPQTKYQALCGLQEYTRLATSLCQEPGELRTAATAIVSALIEKLNEILFLENPGSPQKLPRRWDKALATISRGPPDLNQGYFYYGLLDLVCQLAAVSDPQLLGETLLKRVKDLVFGSVEPKFRWKAIEILLSCHCTRREQYQTLKRCVELRPPVETEANLLEEMRLIRAHLENDEREGLRLRISRPLTRDLQIPDNALGGGFGIPTVPLDSGESQLGGINVLDTSWQENHLAKSDIKSSRTYSPRTFRKLSSSYHSAGLFEDCNHVFFNDDYEVSVYRLGDLRTNPAPPKASKVFSQQYKNGECIRIIAPCLAYVIVVTNKRLLVFNIGVNTSIGPAAHGDWDPSGLACHESETDLVIFSGLCRRNRTNKYNGQIKVHRYRIGDRAQPLPVFVLDIPANDYPKSISYDKHSQILICITRIQNMLLVWELDNEFQSSSEPFPFLKNKYTAETKHTGITSATIYQSPSKRHYVLCTSAPSTERWHHDGEWSFVLSIPPNAALEKDARQGSRIHDFEQLKSRLFAGCSSSQHHVFAVLEESGTLSILRLDKHDDGGIHSPDEETEILRPSLCKQDRPLTHCLRFDPSGSFLFAVDPKGNVVVTEFEKR